MKLTTKDERSLLLYLESCAVDERGLVDHRKMNDEDFAIAKAWAGRGFIAFGRLKMNQIEAGPGAGTYWVWLSPEAWSSAHAERRERAARNVSEYVPIGGPAAPYPAKKEPAR